MTSILPTATEVSNWTTFFYLYVAAFLIAAGYAWCLDVMAERVARKWEDAERRRLDALMGMRRTS